MSEIFFYSRHFASKCQIRHIARALPRWQPIVFSPLSCIITGGPAPILRSVNKVSAKTWRILSENDAISMTTGP